MLRASRIRCIRAFVAIGAMLTAWLVAMPAAYASAPLCDRRGATMLAPAPQLQEPETSIDIWGATDARCLGALLEGVAIDDGSTPSPAPAAHAYEATLPVTPPLARAPFADESAPHDTMGLARPGVRDRVDRPPRV